MSLKSKFKAKRKELTKRVQESIDDTGGFSTVIDLDVARKLSTNKEIKSWKMKEGDHIIDILPFFTGEQHPSLKEDEFAYNVIFYAHYNIGPGKENYVCPLKSTPKGQPTDRCPICEYIDKHNLRETDEELYKKLKPRRRVLYLVWVHDSAQEENVGLQIFDVAHYFMEDKLSAIAKRPRAGGTVLFSDVEIGKSIAFERQGSGIGTTVIGHRFDDRPEEIPDNIIEESFPLDMILKMDVTYKEIHDTFYQSISSEEYVENEEEVDDIPEIPEGQGSEEYEEEYEEDAEEEDTEEEDAEEESPFDKEDAEEEEEPEPEKPRQKLRKKVNPTKKTTEEPPKRTRRMARRKK